MMNLNRNGADLCQKIHDNGRLTRAGHSEQDAVLQYELRAGVFKDLERIKWYLWHGKVFQALNELQSLEIDLDAAAFERKDENSQRLLKGIEELHTCVERNREFVPNYGERYHDGEILHTIDTVNASCGALEGGRIFQISLHQFDALAG
jgi:hypothetical protein